MDWRRALSVALIVVSGAAILLTVIPAVPSNEWWIRVWDFPRSQLLAVIVACLLLSPVVLSLRKGPVLIGLAALVGAGAWQAYRVWPYTPLAATEAVAMASCPVESRLLLLTANVQVSNRTSEPLLTMVDQTQPDLVLLVETNQWWDEELEPFKQAYREHISQAREDGYGMHLFSRYELIDPQVRFLLEDYVPSIKTGVRLPSGREITFHGVHPVPPPLEDTEERDAELLLIAREIREEQTSAIVAGDLNDVGWSRTTRLFQEISGTLDPRIGRGPFPTFNADWPILRWPLDYVFFDPSFRLVDMGLMDHVGSDHFPLLIELCHAPELVSVQRNARPSPAEVERASEAIQQGREEAR